MLEPELFLSWTKLIRDLLTNFTKNYCEKEDRGEDCNKEEHFEQVVPYQAKLVRIFLISHHHSWEHKPQSYTKLDNKSCGMNLMIATPPTWFPKTPMDVAELIWWGGNQVAANWAGIPRMKIWLTATTLWPRNVSHHWSGWVANTFNQLPRQVPAEPSSTPRRSPCKRWWWWIL